jgi:hypothetical protein
MHYKYDKVENMVGLLDLSTRNLAHHFLWMTQQGPSSSFIQLIAQKMFQQYGRALIGSPFF